MKEDSTIARFFLIEEKTVGALSTNNVITSEPFNNVAFLAFKVGERHVAEA